MLKLYKKMTNFRIQGAKVSFPKPMHPTKIQARSWVLELGDGWVKGSQRGREHGSDILLKSMIMANCSSAFCVIFCG